MMPAGSWRPLRHSWHKRPSGCSHQRSKGARYSRPSLQPAGLSEGDLGLPDREARVLGLDEMSAVGAGDLPSARAFSEKGLARPVGVSELVRQPGAPFGGPAPGGRAIAHYPVRIVRAGLHDPVASLPLRRRIGRSPSGALVTSCACRCVPMRADACRCVPLRPRDRYPRGGNRRGCRQPRAVRRPGSVPDRPG